MKNILNYGIAIIIAISVFYPLNTIQGFNVDSCIQRAETEAENKINTVERLMGINQHTQSQINQIKHELQLAIESCKGSTQSTIQLCIERAERQAESKIAEEERRIGSRGGGGSPALTQMKENIKYQLQLDIANCKNNTSTIVPHPNSTNIQPPSLQQNLPNFKHNYYLEKRNDLLNSLNRNNLDEILTEYYIYTGLILDNIDSAFPRSISTEIEKLEQKTIKDFEYILNKNIYKVYDIQFNFILIQQGFYTKYNQLNSTGLLHKYCNSHLNGIFNKERLACENKNQSGIYIMTSKVPFCYRDFKYDEPTNSCKPNTENPTIFNDLNIENHVHYDAIVSLREKNIIEGYPDGTFKPNNRINRAEFTKIVVSSINNNPSGDNCFSDVKNEWFAKFVCYASQSKIIEGYPDGTFKPELEINKVEALKIVLEAYFDNIPNTNQTEWYSKYIDFAKNNNIYLDEVWLFNDQKLTRGQMAELIFRVQNLKNITM